MSKLTDQFKNARRVSTPLVAITTPDPAATMSAIQSAFTNGETPAFLVWDIARGVTANNEQGFNVLTAIMDKDDPAMATNPVDFLTAKATKAPMNTIIFLLNAQRYLSEASVIQAIWNLRDEFKRPLSKKAKPEAHDRRTLVLLAPSITLPVELSNDIYQIDEAYPDEQQITEIINDTYSAVGLPAPDSTALARAVDALVGIAAYPAEQASAMSIKKDGIDTDALWERKRKKIETLRGVSVYRGKEKFVDAGGCENVKRFFSFNITCKTPPRIVVIFDEMEKGFAGMSGDNTGATQEMAGEFLTFTQDRNVRASLLLGIAGCGKTNIAKALGNELGCMVITVSLGGMKDSLLGKSTENLRELFKTIDVISQGRIFFVATCNDIKALPPEVLRRFDTTFFFDLPTAEERKQIWAIWMKNCNIQPQELPDDENWTGAEIRKCCLLSESMNISLLEASGFVVPIAVSCAEKIQTLRRESAGKYLSAAEPGLYKLPPTFSTVGTPKKRAIAEGE